jgi:hypothetical protein
VLASIIVNTIDAALDVVLAHTAVLVTAQAEARAGFDHEEIARVEPGRPPRMREPTPAERIRRLGKLALSRASGQSEIGDEVIDAMQVVVVPQDHLFFTFTRRARAVKRDADPEASCRRSGHGAWSTGGWELHDAGKHADSVKKAQEAAAAINLQLKMKE